jgi:hypothetical protein
MRRFDYTWIRVLLAGAALGSIASFSQPSGRPAQTDCPAGGSAPRNAVAVRNSIAADIALFVSAHPAPRVVRFYGSTASIPHVNFIDDEILGAMDRAGVAPAPISGDAEFLRRVTIDLTGRIPDPGTVQSFLSDSSPTKRDRVIDALLASDAFVDRWTFFYDELFRVTASATTGNLGVTGRNAIHSYFQSAVRSGKPYDQVARELMTAAGDSYSLGAPNFTVRNLQNNGPIQDTFDNLASTTGGVFLGTSIFCLSCHNGIGHTDQINIWLSQKTRQDFWGMSAFYARTTARRVGTGNGNFEYDVEQKTTGDYLLNTTDGNKTARQNWIPGLTSVSPKFILNGSTPQSGEDYRAALGRLLTADPQFARASVNYLWKELFGLGIVEPVDGFDLSRQDPANPPPAPWALQPTHPNLLVRLGDEFRADGYDLRSILRTIVRSSSYQLSSSYTGTWSDADIPLFARHFPRRLTAEEMLDAITMATGLPASLPVQGFGAPVGWAMQLPDPLEPTGTGSSFKSFLDTFGRGNRDSTPASTGGSILQALSLMNNRIVTDRVKSVTSGSAAKRLVDAGTSPAGTVTALYLGSLSRPPSAQELSAGVALFSNLKPGQTASTVTEDLQYTLLNKLDFVFNY